jgi:signal transduction histidine kinase
MVHQDSGRTAFPASADGDAVEGQQASTGGWQRGLKSLWMVKNWRIRRRVLALVIIPSVAAIVLGVLRIQVAQDTSAAAARTSQLGILGEDVTALADSVQDERDLTAGYVATRLSGNSGQAASILSGLERRYAVAGGQLTTVERLAGGVGAAYPATARADLTFALSSLSALTELRSLAHSEMSPLPLIEHYSAVVATLLAFDSDLAEGSSSAQLAQTVTSLESLAQTEEEASQQRAILYAAFLEGQFEPGALSALVAAQSSQASDLASFQQNSTSLPAFVPPSGLSPVLTETQQFNDTVTGPAVDAALAAELDAVVSGDDGQPLSGNPPQAWFNDMSFTLAAMRSVESNNLASVVTQADTLQQGAQNSEKLTAVAVGVLLLLILIVTILMARSMIRPLRKLQTDALDVADHRLPDVVRRLNDSEDAAKSVQVEPIGIDSTDEIGEVARAFDRVHSEAVRLAAEEALLRTNLNAMFVNLSRRSQSLIERQLSIIDSLEQSEQDPDRLSNLFRLDHLATRMRRNSENLLVLAGHEAPRKWTQPVAFVDVLRAAISEIEQYERISLNVQPGIVIAGRAASDVVHLVAELLENAAAFSPEHTQVFVTGQLLSSGGVLIDISDQGLGIPDQELEYANWRLDNPPVIDVAVSRRMGLFVVGRLAARHGIRVRLRHASSGGLSALIWVPEPVAEVEHVPPLDKLRQRLDADVYVAASPVPFQQSPSGPLTRPLAARAREAANGGWFPRRSANSPSAAPSAPVLPTGPVVPPATAVPRAPTVLSPASGPQAAIGVPQTEPEPADSGFTDEGLPIYDSVESDWFRRSGKSFSMGSQSPRTWASPGDEGFRAASAAASPTAGETTGAGLPKRVPKANLVPGSISDRRSGHAEDSEPAAGVPPRSADDVRNRMANFQRGAREGRAAAPWDFGTDEN